MAKGTWVDHFKDLEDPRRDNSRHNLIDIMFITICAVTSGADTWEEIADFGRARESWLRTHLELPHGIPSDDTFARVFALLDARQFNSCFLKWIGEISPAAKQIIDIDGKTLRSSGDTANGKAAIHMVSAWAQKAGLTLAQVKVDEKSNEITAIPELLEVLEMEGAVVTIDAMGTQKSIAEKIIHKGADYVLALKANQESLYEDVRLFFEDVEQTPAAGGTPSEDGQIFDYHRSVEKDHGRIEMRECRATEQIDWLHQKPHWEGLRSVCMIKAQRTIGEQTSVERRFYISSLAGRAEQLSATVRAHWAIENSLHWVLDVAFHEDACRKRKDHSAENFSIVRRIALNLLKRDRTTKKSIAWKRHMAGWDPTYLEKILFPKA